jgi:hypothetical protein
MSATTAVKVVPPGLGVAIESLGIDPWAPMLDWTAHGLASHLPGRTLFRPVEPNGGELPYMDHTIEVVFVDDVARMDEAARVATVAVLLVAADEAGGALVVETRRIRAERGPAPVPASVLILVATEPDDEWLGHLTEAVAERPAIEVRATVDPLAVVAETNAATVVLVEHGVLPLPGCIEAAERVLSHDQQVGGVAVKLLASGGSLEAAGAAAFADGSVEGVAAGAPPAAQWHEYVRPVPAAVGVAVLRSAAVRESASAEGAGTFDLVRISADLWSSGWELRYQPDAVAVRMLPAVAAEARFWPHARDGLPARPAELGERSWRRLLARGEVGAFR